MRLAALVGLVVLASTRAASAQTDPVAAEALFDDARRLMSQGKTAEACGKFAESQRLDPGLGTLLNLGECYDKSGQTARAWETFREAEALAGRAHETARATYAHKRAGELEQRVARISIVVPSEVRVAGLQVLRDGAFLTEPLWGVSVPIDPGTHSLEARAPGYVTWKTSFEANGKSAQTVTVPALERNPAVDLPPQQQTPIVTPTATPVSPIPPTSTNAAMTPAAPDTPPSAGSGQKTVGIIVSVIGVVSLGTGAVFGGLAVSKDSGARSAGCDPTTCPDASSLAASNDAQAFARVSTWSFILGGVMLAGGVALWLTAPKPARANIAWPANALRGSF